MGKTSLWLRMVHECSQRKLTRAEVVFGDTLAYDYMAVMRKLRDDMGLECFGPFTDLMNYYTDAAYSPRMSVDIHVDVHAEDVQVAQGMSMNGCQVGSISGVNVTVPVKDNMIVVQRSDLPVPIEMRRRHLTERFIDGLRARSHSENVVILFDAVEKMQPVTHDWLWEQLLRPVRDGALPNVRIVVCGQRPPPRERDWADFIACAELSALSTNDISTYISRRVEDVSEDTRREVAVLIEMMSKGRPADVAECVDRFIRLRSESK
jgi:hypothetical protein